MSHEKIEALEIGLYEDYLEELQKKYYGGINKVLGEPWFTKTDAEIDASDERDPAPVDMTPWEHAKTVSYGIMASTVGIYLLLTMASN